MKRPNILLIYTDQHRWDAMGVNGNPDVQTPNMDRLANEGVNFDHYFIQNPVCMPSRVSFLTGQYPSTTGITHMGVPVPEDFVTLPKMLRNSGYHSANIGKLHFLPHANRNHSEVHPDYGFDHLEISDEPGPYEDAYRAWVRKVAPDQLDHLSVGLPPAAEQWYKMMRVNDTVHHPEERFPKRPIEFPGKDEFTHTAWVADRSIQYMKERAQSGSPFMCIAGIYSPHSPWVAPKRFLDLYDPDKLTLPSFPPEVDEKRKPDHYDDAELRLAQQGYYGMVSEVDHHVGRMLDTLEELGLSDDTIVIFTSDHGEWLGEHLKYGKGYPGHDCVSRVPMLMRVPGVEGGKRVSHLVEGVDIVPTLLELCGAPVPPHLQGTSLTSLISGDDEPVKDIALMEFNGWKMIRSQDYRYIAHDDGREFLYDLNAAWGEYRDVAGDAGYVEALAKHRQLLIQRIISMERPRKKIWSY
ncbi:MAG: sulfatase-like hydrolase/transferase [Candidatus Latescibacteria bacterium]|nr:sulfatase-like hydrolase/transferase [Candidatus Latescibacterota bacterium]